MSNIGHCRTLTPFRPPGLIIQKRRTGLNSPLVEEVPNQKRYPLMYEKAGFSLVCTSTGHKPSKLKENLSQLGVTSFVSLRKFVSQPDWESKLLQMPGMGPTTLRIIEIFSKETFQRKDWKEFFSAKASSALSRNSIDSFGDLQEFLRNPNWRDKIMALPQSGLMTVREIEERAVAFGIDITFLEVGASKEATSLLKRLGIERQDQLRLFVESDPKWFLKVMRTPRATWKAFASIKSAAQRAGAIFDYCPDIHSRHREVFNILQIKTLNDLRKLFSQTSWVTKVLGASSLPERWRGSVIKDFDGAARLLELSSY